MLKENKKIKYFAYLRKSTEDDGRQVQSIADQESELKKVIEREKLNVVEWFREEKSAKKPNNRPEFSKMIKRIKCGEANGILCWKINRLSRNPYESGILGQLLHDKLLISIQTREKEFTIKDNDILFGVETGSSSQYSKELAEDVLRGLESKVKKGWRPGSCPLGYINNKYKEKGEKDISIDPITFPIVKKLFDLFLTGKYLPIQLLRIANDELGLRTRKTKKQGGKKLAETYIYKVLRNPFYAGFFDWDGQRFIPGKHKPMITVSQYDEIQLLLGKKGNPRPRIYNFPFKQVLRCGECLGAVTAEYKRKHNKKNGKTKIYTYYHCTRKKRDVKCSQKAVVSEQELNKQFELELQNVTILPEFKELALKKLEKDYGEKIREREDISASLSTALLETKKQLHNLIKMKFKEFISDEQFKLEKAELELEIKKLESNLKNSDEEEKEIMGKAERAFDFITYAHYWFINGDSETKMDILHGLGSNFLLKDKKLVLDPGLWFIPVKDGYPKIESKYIRFELDKTPESERTDEQKQVFEEIKNEWSGRRESNPQQKLGRLWFYH